MTEDEARRIAEEELRRINAVLDLDVQIESAGFVYGLWSFSTIGRGSGPDRSQHFKGIMVDAEGRIRTPLTVRRSEEQRARLRASLANADDLRWLIPRSKYDDERYEAVIALGYIYPLLSLGGYIQTRWMSDPTP